MNLRPELREKLIDRFLLGGLVGLSALIVNLGLESYRDHRSAAAMEQAASDSVLSPRLRNFYYPLANHLTLDSIYYYHGDWRLIDRPTQRAFFERSTTLANQTEILQVLDSHGDLLATDSLLRAQAFHFMLHARLQRTLRETGENAVTADSLGAPWPAEFLPLIRQRAKALESRLATCRKGGDCAIPFASAP